MSRRIRRARTVSVTPLSWRGFLSATVGATAGLAGILAVRTLPLYAATRTVTMMTWNHFVIVSDDIPRKTAWEFGKVNKCRVKIDFIPHRETGTCLTNQRGQSNEADRL